MYWTVVFHDVFLKRVTYLLLTLIQPEVQFSYQQQQQFRFAFIIVH